MATPFDNPLPGIPDIESPLFEQIFAAKDISDETRRIARSLHDDGFAVFQFPEPNFDETADSIVRALDSRYDWEPWRAGQPHGPRVQDAWQTNDAVKRVAVNSQVLELLAQLYGRRAFPFQTLNFPVGTEQHYHTDSVHFSTCPERFMCGVWVALEDTDADNGSLMYFPGSHKWPIYTNEHIGRNPNPPPDVYANYNRYVETWRALVLASGKQPVEFHARKGQALIWAANLLHGGAAHKDRQRTRHSQVTHYYFEGCCYYTPLTSLPFLGAIHFRQPSDIATGAAVRNELNRQLLSQSHIQYCEPANHLTPPDLCALPADFDPSAYLAANPDVAAAGVDPIRHWHEFGHREGRRLR